MSKPKKSDAAPPPPPAPTASQSAPVERPRKGGSYVIGKEGGTPKRVAHTRPAGEEESPVQAETQTAGDGATTDQDQEG
ncbi:MAG: hypothetical protein GW855_07915 [Erythrobacter sp.]|nr:hypothetical protein [Erythrobacter sp.]NCQ62464.1 hypothetical protein [Alphaproteobacteria bacterium]